MAELAQPLAAAPDENPGETTVGGPSFSELVYAHFDWWRAIRDRRPSAAATSIYRETLRRFEQTQGRILQAYWCSHLESAVVLTELPCRFPRRHRSPQGQCSPCRGVRWR